MDTTSVLAKCPFLPFSSDLFFYHEGLSDLVWMIFDSLYISIDKYFTSMSIYSDAWLVVCTFAHSLLS